MAGILNKKSRIMDVIVTREGRRQIADGNLRASFASFTDRNAFYEKDVLSGSTDPTSRIYFESFSTDRDKIIFEKDDSGRLIGELPISDLTVLGDNIFQKNSAGQYLIVTSSVFATEVESIITSSIYNFDSQKIIGSEKGDNFNPKTFDVSRNVLHFDINNYTPFGGSPADYSIDVNALTPLFFDKKMANQNQFKFLPPVHTDGGQVANFNDIGSPNKLKVSNSLIEYKSWEIYANIKDDSKDENINQLFDQEDVFSSFTQGASALYGAGNSNNADLIQHETVNILNTSDANNLYCQVFEVSSNTLNKKLIKLDVINAVNFEIDLSKNPIFESQRGHEEKNVYYVGKVFEDDFGVPSFVRIFTIVFD
jgi:hypothetical protein